jgi:hypothetical protein
MKTKTKKALFFRLNRRLALAALAVIVVLVAVLELTNTTHFFHKQKTPPVIPTSKVSNQLSPNNSSTTPSPSSPASSGPVSDKTPSSSAGSGSAPLIAPYGTFVSNHHPGDNSPNDEISYCYTTPGAACYIKFTKSGSGETTRLASQTTGSDGSTSWSWNVSNDAHLGSGHWEITAIATLSGQTKSTSDSLELVVGP